MRSLNLMFFAAGRCPGLTYYKVMFKFFQPLMRQTAARLLAVGGVLSATS